MRAQAANADLLLLQNVWGCCVVVVGVADVVFVGDVGSKAAACYDD